MITNETLSTAISEAKRFIEKAEVLQDRMVNDPGYHHPTHAAAVKRSSMDLTRALAQLRSRDDGR